MKKVLFLAAVASALGLLASLAGAEKSATIRLQSADVAAEIIFDTKQKMTVTSKPATIKPGNYTVKALTLSKKDAKGKTWEMRSYGAGPDSMHLIAVDPGQDKVLLLGPKVWVVALKSNGAGGVLKLTVEFVGESSEHYYPGAFCEGKAPPAPTVTVKDLTGKVVASGPLTVNDAGTHMFTGKLAPGFTGKVTVEVSAVMGPFELVQTERKITIP